MAINNDSAKVIDEIGDMKINEILTDDVVLAEVGQRLAQRRISLEMTQARLADEAGVSKRTVERFENGESAQFLSVIRMLRALDLLPNLDVMIPAVTASPLDAVKRGGRVRQRASSPRRKARNADWEWKERH
jgi:transcriptional regulator with XRE-family HTH domain